MPNSPFTSDNSFGLLSEESFDTTFPFLNPEAMDYYIASPDSNNEETFNMPRVIPSQTSPPTGTEESLQHQQETNIGPSEGDMSHLSLQSPPGHTHTNAQSQETPFGYSQYDLHYQHPASHASHFHPYRSYGGLRSPKFIHSPPEPLSPPLSLSPPGSTSSKHKHQALLNTPPNVVSPTMVSPASALSDLSPPGIGWSYPLPLVHGAGTGYGPPLGTFNQMPQGSPGSGLSMVQGFPYPTSPFKGSSSTRVMRPRMSRNATSSSATIKKEKSDDELMDSDEEDDPGKGGLGLTPATVPEGRTTVSAKREDVRKARIESEQRRRDELREGFKRLKDALPQSNQRSSKSSLLDRSVAHIQQIESANHYLLAQLKTANQELIALRATNQELVHAVALHGRVSSGSSPGSNNGKN